MSISASLLPEFDQEMATTRRVLERAGEEHFSYKPHEKSMSLGTLASHLANIPTWVTTGVTTDFFDMAAGFENQMAKSNQELLETFDKNVATAREALAKTEDGTFMQTWSLKMGDKVLLSFPKVAVVRSFAMNHMVHHRGQLSVYLRLNDVPVPSIYGPSADEGAMGAGA